MSEDIENITTKLTEVITIANTVAKFNKQVNSLELALVESLGCIDHCRSILRRNYPDVPVLDKLDELSQLIIKALSKSKELGNGT